MPSPRPKRTITHNDPSQPLSPKREAFVLAVCAGQNLTQSHKSAGYEGDTHAAAWQLRHTREVDARIRWMLKERVAADTRSFARRQKSKGDLLERAVKELEAIAFQDVAEIADWRREPVFNAAGEVQGVRDNLVIRDSASMPRETRKSVKGVFMKAGELRLELHDKRAALESLIKALKGDDVATTNHVTVNQVNVGDVSAADAAKRVAFLLGAALPRPQVTMIDVTPVLGSKETDEADEG